MVRKPFLFRFLGVKLWSSIQEKDIWFSSRGRRVELAEIKTICSDMYRSPVPSSVLNKSSDLSFIEDLFVGRSIRVDIFIGLEYCWKLVTDETKRVDSLVAQRTLCSWMLSGEYRGGQSVPARKTQLMFCTKSLPETISESLISNLWELEGNN